MSFSDILDFFKKYFLPEAIDTTLAIVIFVLCYFSYKLLIYYWGTIRPEVKKQKEDIKEEQKEKQKEEKELNNKMFDRIVDVYNKINEISEAHSSKFVTREEVERLESKIDQTREEISNIKGQMGI